jgi:hypothetical protein
MFAAATGATTVNFHILQGMFLSVVLARIAALVTTIMDSGQHA